MQSVKAHIDKLDLSKLRASAFSMKLSRGWKDKPQTVIGLQIMSIDKELVSRIHEELSKLKGKTLHCF